MDASRDRNGKFSNSHGLTKTPEFRVWSDMKRRCLNPKNSSYPRYGGRGITVCERWQESFQNFLEDMGARPSRDHSIDRIDNNGHYSPENCRWADRSTQQKNKRPPPRTTKAPIGNASVRPGRYRNRLKTHCPKGHEYDLDNTIFRRRRDGCERHCRKCDIARKCAARANQPENSMESANGQA